MGERYTERVRGKRLGRETLIISVTSRTDAGISMAKGRNKNEEVGG